MEIICGTYRLQGHASIKNQGERRYRSKFGGLNLLFLRRPTVRFDCQRLYQSAYRFVLNDHIEMNWFRRSFG